MLAVIETHPIQYHAPVYRMLQQAHGIPVTAIYGSDFSVAGYRDRDFGTTFAWDTDLLSGYRSVFLSKVSEGGATSADAVSARGLAEVLRELKPSAVLTVGYSPRFHRDAWLASWLGGYPILFRGETTDQTKARSWWKQMGRDTALRLIYGRSARLLYVGRHSKAHFERLGVAEDRLVFSPYCVDASVFDCGESARALARSPTRELMSATDTDRVFLFSGKLTRHKGVDHLVAAAKALPVDQRTRTVLGFVGDGPLRAELELQAAAAPAIRTAFVGFQKQRGLSRFYHAADVLVLPSHSETWGLVVNEALHHGIPCVVSDRVGCAVDLIDEGRTGHVVTAGSIEALTSALISAWDLCDQPDVRTACRAKVDGYTIERAAAGVASAYNSAIRGDKAA